MSHETTRAHSIGYGIFTIVSFSPPPTKHVASPPTLENPRPQGSAALTVMPWRAAGDSYAAGADGSGCGVGPQETQTLWVSALTATAHSVFLSGGASMGPPLLTASRCERRPRLERKFSKNLGGLIQKPGSSGFGLLTETDGEVRFSLLATRYRSTEKSQNVVDVVR